MRWLALLLFLTGPALAQPSVVPTTQATVPISMNTATTTRFVTGAAGQSIYVVHWIIVAGGTATNVTFVTGTGTNCGTGQSSLTGAMTVAATTQASMIISGSGTGAVLVVPVGQDLCLTNSAAQPIAGSLAYSRF